MGKIKLYKSLNEEEKKSVYEFMKLETDYINSFEQISYMMPKYMIMGEIGLIKEYRVKGCGNRLFVKYYRLKDR